MCGLVGFFDKLLCQISSIKPQRRNGTQIVKLINLYYFYTSLVERLITLTWQCSDRCFFFISITACL